MTEKKELLFDQFPPVSTEEWRAKVEADLKGAPFEKKLVWRTNEGFNVQPMYRAEDIAGLKTTDSLPGEFPYVRGTPIPNWSTIGKGAKLSAVIVGKFSASAKIAPGNTVHITATLQNASMEVRCNDKRTVTS